MVTAETVFLFPSLPFTVQYAIFAILAKKHAVQKMITKRSLKVKEKKKELRKG